MLGISFSNEGPLHATQEITSFVLLPHLLLVHLVGITTCALIISAYSSVKSSFNMELLEGKVDFLARLSKKM